MINEPNHFEIDLFEKLFHCTLTLLKFLIKGIYGILRDGKFNLRALNRIRLFQHLEDVFSSLISNELTLNFGPLEIRNSRASTENIIHNIFDFLGVRLFQHFDFFQKGSDLLLAFEDRFIDNNRKAVNNLSLVVVEIREFSKQLKKRGSTRR